MQTLDLSDLATRGFLTLNFRFSKQESDRIFNLFDQLCLDVESNYESVSIIDQIIDDFIAQAKTPIANDTLKLKNFTIDSLKYKHRTNDEYNIRSLQYLEGQNEYLAKKLTRKDQRRLNACCKFFQALQDAHTLIRQHMAPWILQAEKVKPCITLLKIWKHTPSLGNPHFLPLHFDRSILTMVVCTQSEGEECLRIYPPRSGLTQDKSSDDQAYKPEKTDFPLLFPGGYAQECFGLEPAPHCVVANQATRARYSLIFFIAKQEGW